MVWLRLEDNMLDHPKWRRAIRLAGDDALGVWIRLVSWCSRNLTDGAIPADMVEEVAETKGDRGRRRALEALISSSLVARDEHGACTIVDYLERNPSRSDVRAERDRRAQAERLRRGKPRVTGHESAGVPDRAHVPSQSRPVPSQSQPKDPPVAPQGGDPSPEPKAKRVKSRTKLPDDFAPTTADNSLAVEMGVSLEAEFPKFCEYHRARGTLGADWRAALRYWLRNSKRFSAPARAPDDRLRTQANRVQWLREREAAEEASRRGAQ